MVTHWLLIGYSLAPHWSLLVTHCYSLLYYYYYYYYYYYCCYCYYYYYYYYYYCYYYFTGFATPQSSKSSRASTRPPGQGKGQA